MCEVPLQRKVFLMSEVPLYREIKLWSLQVGASALRRVLGRPGLGAGSYLGLIDFCITQLKVQGPSRTCNESKEEEGDSPGLTNWYRKPGK